LRVLKATRTPMPNAVTGADGACEVFPGARTEISCQKSKGLRDRIHATVV
jgi:hypothetical protein